MKHDRPAPGLIEDPRTSRRARAAASHPSASASVEEARRPKAAPGELMHACALLSRERRVGGLATVIVEQSLDVTRSDLAALYVYQVPENPQSGLALLSRRGEAEVAATMSGSSDLVAFLRDCSETLVVSSPEVPFFVEAILAPGMRSAVAIPLAAEGLQLGILLLNAKAASHYDRERVAFLDSFGRMAGNLLHGARLNDALRGRLEKIVHLVRSRQEILSSMPGLLITTDAAGAVRSFNRIAGDRFGLDGSALGSPIERLFASSMDGSVLAEIRRALVENRELLGIEGIFRRGADSIDFSLNVAPLRSKRGRLEGLTLLFADQTAERELKERGGVVVDERRAIKDLFAGSLSRDLIEALVRHPELVKPGGDRIPATLLFADVRGYASFAETQPPEYAVGVLNAYFSRVVEVIDRHRGFMDRFVGGAFLAAWGVPVRSEGGDAIEAVSAALEIQGLLRSGTRALFPGKAAKAQVGMGLHSGALVAGRLGSARRPAYSLIGDTVKVAARLEREANGGEILITQDTRDLLGDHFTLKELAPVALEGRARPIHIFSVIARA